MEGDVSFWQSRIKLIQAPEQFIPQPISENAVPFYQKHEDIRSFLYDPFGENPPGTYGLELRANENVEVFFFTRAESRNDAIQLGYAWITNLKYKFIGLDGVVEAESIKQETQEIQNNNHLLEIKLPKGFIKNKINIVERFIKAFYCMKGREVQLFIL